MTDRHGPWANSDNFLVFAFFSPVRCIKFAIFVYSQMFFVQGRRSSSADVNTLCFYANKL